MRERDRIATHEPAQCAGSWCTLHNPSDHHMVDWPVFHRLDLRPVLIERICPHAIGHPDPDSVRWIADQLAPLSEESIEELKGWLSVHGCDGCCREEGHVRTVGQDAHTVPLGGGGEPARSELDLRPRGPGIAAQAPGDA